MVQEGPREEEIVESDTEEEILEERYAVPVRIPGGSPAAAIPAPIDHGMCLSMVNIKLPHLADLDSGEYEEIHP